MEQETTATEACRTLSVPMHRATVYRLRLAAASSAKGSRPWLNGATNTPRSFVGRF
jgi:hypothetical protein